MKLLLCAVNSQYIHSNPALYALSRALESLASPPAWQLAEYSINQSREAVLRELYAARPDILACSAYIWNIDYLERLLADFHQLLPETKIILGGPEATACSTELLERLPCLSGIVLGEGEVVWPELVARLQAGEVQPELAGVQWRGQEHQSGLAPLPDLAQLPFMYTAPDLAKFAAEGKVIYYESSRGCPYGCSFCCSAEQPLRQRPIELVLKELPQLAVAKQVKFVDRTFNADPKRAAAIIEAILQLYRPNLSWHFEISPYQLPEQLLELINQAPPGYLRLEAGLQSLHQPTLKAIRRGGDWSSAAANIKRIMAADSAHLHLDLIAGLPEETPASFAAAFAEVYALQPHYLQLGFLKILPGTRLAGEAKQRGLLFSPAPPYTVLATPTMSAEYLFQLALADKALNGFYNNGRFRQTLRFAAEYWPKGALDFYFALSIAQASCTSGSLSLVRKVELLAELLLPLGKELFFDLLRLDWLSYNDNQPLPSFLRSDFDSRGGKKEPNRYYFAHSWHFNSAGWAIASPGEQMLAFDWQAPRIGAGGRVRIVGE
jgi:radical SAM superfamily enzyme YgiQ (UPF0313 family)